MKRSNPLIYMLLTVALVIAGCNRNTIYHHYEHTPLAGWEKNDVVTFAVPAAKERAVVQRDIELRISEDFPFQAINLVVEQTTYPSAIRRRDTLNCKLFDPKGNIKGSGMSLYQYHFHLPDISLNQGDSLSVTIHHNMKREILPGIADIGLILTAY